MCHPDANAILLFEQESSQGLKEIANEEKPSRRATAIKNNINDLPLTYRGSPDSSLLLGRDFFVDICYGDGFGNLEMVYPPAWSDFVENLCRAKRLGMEKFKQQLDQQQPSPNNRY